MKKSFLSVALCACLSFGVGAQAVNASAFNTMPTTVTQNVEHLENGITVITELTVSNNARAKEKTSSILKTYKYGNKTIGKIGINGKFRYDGKTVKVVSKSVKKQNLASGWSFSQDSFTSSGGTISLSGELEKSISENINIDITLSCDKDGNIY